MAEALRAQLDAASALADSKPKTAVTQLKELIASDSSDIESIKVKEQAIEKLTDVLAKQKDEKGLAALFTDLRPLYAQIPKAKTGKIVAIIIRALAEVPDTNDFQITVCREQIEWARDSKFNFLRQRIELRLATLLMDNKSYQPAIELIAGLLTEVKKLDDKLMLVHIHLLESAVHHALLNTPKSKAALTAARAAASSIYVPPRLQAEIDIQSGILNAEEKDYKTGYSYFFEAFEQYNNLGHEKALPCLKYMLLCKIMSESADDVPGLISSKGGLKYTGPDLDAMKAVAKAHQASSLNGLKDALKEFEPQLDGDPIVKRHLQDLFRALLEQNLIRIIQPYSKVEVSQIAKLIKLDGPTVERELSQMILDKKLAGTLDQGTGCLEVFDEQAEDKMYPAALEVIKNMGGVVDSLFARSQKLVA